MKIQFTSLKYYNSPISEECLYVGILFYNLASGKRTFNTIKKFSRLESFDDEIDVNFMKLYLQGIKDEVENNIFNYDKEFDLQKYINTYVNELRFSKITTVEAENDDIIDTITKVYLKFDCEKKDRLSINNEKDFIKQLLASSNLKFNHDKLFGTYNENISYDFLINDNVIKMFTFKKKQLNKMITHAKSWAFTANELNGRYQTIFLYDHELKDDENFKAIIRILQKNALCTPLQEGLDYIIAKNA